MMYFKLIRLFLRAGSGSRYELCWITFSPAREGNPPEVLVREFGSRLDAFLWGLDCVANFTPLDQVTLWVDGKGGNA